MADNLIQQFLTGQSGSTEVLKRTLDAQSMRQRAHAQNIANAETPNYQRIKVDFEEQLKSTLAQRSANPLATSDLRHMRGNDAGSVEELQAQMKVDRSAVNGSGVNSVDIDAEMAEMAETQIRYLTAVELLKRRYANLKSAIKGQ
jgi:flagellar basal-body rod protein FlgB